MRLYKYFKNIIRNIKYLYTYSLQREWVEITHDIYKNNNRLEKIPRRVKTYDEDMSNIYYKIKRNMERLESVEHNLRAENGINIKIDKLENHMEDKLLFIQDQINDMKDCIVDEYKRTEEHREYINKDIEELQNNVGYVQAEVENKLSFDDVISCIEDSCYSQHSLSEVKDNIIDIEDALKKEHSVNDIEDIIHKSTYGTLKDCIVFHLKTYVL